MKRVRGMGFVLFLTATAIMAPTVQAQDLCFEAPVNYAAGGGRSVFAADLDGDGDADLAAANGSANVSVLKNNGDGTFAAAVYYAAGGWSTSVFAADLDGDNDADLVVDNYAGDDVSVLKNNGDGSFAAPVNYAVGDVPGSIFAADLDGDNDADLAVANAGSDDVSVLKNNGDGTLAAAANYAVGGYPRSVFAADLDGDNDADLVVANSLPANVSVLRNNGDGTFAAAVDYAAGDYSNSVFAADLDGDNDADLAVANYGSGNVSVLKNNGDGTFAAAVNYTFGTNPWSVFAADLDGDGDADLAVTNVFSDNVSVLKNNGDGTFAAAVSYAAGADQESVFAADLDGDNDADLAVANDYSGYVSVLKNSLLPIIVSRHSNSGCGCLRSAIETANAHSGSDTIFFSVAGTIQPTTPLPGLSDGAGTVIDGFSAPGAIPGKPTVILDGSSVTTDDALGLWSNNNTVRGLVIRHFPGGIGVSTNGPSPRNTLSRNLIYANVSWGITLVGTGFKLAAPVIDTVFLNGSDSVFYVAGTAANKSTIELYLAERYLGADTVQYGGGRGGSWLYLGSDTADNVTGHWVFPQVPSRAWSYVTATATDTLGNTSEFALNRRLVPDSLIYTAYCPVYMIVTSPDGKDSIGPGFNTFGSTASYDDTHDWGLGPNGVPDEPDKRVTITNIQPGEYKIEILPDPGGAGNYFFGIRVDGTEAKHWAKIDGFGDTTHTELRSTAYPNPVPPPGEMAKVGYTPTAPRRGDLISDGVYNIQDVVEEVNYAFRSKPLPHPALLADVNCDGFACNIQDVVKLIDTVFRGGAEPCP